MSNIYISSLSMRRQPTFRKGHSIDAKGAKATVLGPVSSAIFLGVILALMGLLYLSQITKTNNLSFTISQLDTQKKELVEENQVLVNEAARLASIERVKNSKVASSLQSTQPVEYYR